MKGIWSFLCLFSSGIYFGNWMCGLLFNKQQQLHHLDIRLHLNALTMDIKRNIHFSSI